MQTSTSMRSVTDAERTGPRPAVPWTAALAGLAQGDEVVRVRRQGTVDPLRALDVEAHPGEQRGHLVQRSAVDRLGAGDDAVVHPVPPVLPPGCGVEVLDHADPAGCERVLDGPGESEVRGRRKVVQDVGEQQGGVHRRFGEARDVATLDPDPGAVGAGGPDDLDVVLIEVEAPDLDLGVQLGDVALDHRSPAAEREHPAPDVGELAADDGERRDADPGRLVGPHPGRGAPVRAGGTEHGRGVEPRPARARRHRRRVEVCPPRCPFVDPDGAYGKKADIVTNRNGGHGGGIPSLADSETSRLRLGDDGQPGRTASSRGRGRWWRDFVLILVVGSVWALALPLLSGPDEESHAVRAAAMVRGDVVGHTAPGDRGSQLFRDVDVPEAYRDARDMNCVVRSVSVLPTCQPKFDGGSRLVDVPTYQYRQPPAYY